MKRIVAMLLAILIAQTVYGSSEADRWREDLEVLAKRLPEVHANAFHKVTRAQFDSAVRILHERIPSLSREQIIIEMMRIVAMIGDGHTSLTPLYDPSIGFHYYPLSLYLFSDGLHVEKTDSENKDIAGARLVQIGATPIEDVWKSVSTMVAHDNEMGIKSLAPFYVVIPEILKALGYIQDEQNVKFTFELNGKRFEKTFHPAGTIQPIYHDAVLNTDGWVDARAGEVPLFLKNRQDAYWYEYLPQEKTVYVQYNSVRNKHGETIETFFQRVFDFVEKNPVEKFVLDVRFNRGGNNYFNKPIVVGLIQSKKINRRGQLFVIIGRDTFSAAQNLVNEIEKYTDALFVGEPTGENVNFYGDHEAIVLPNSGIRVMASTLWWQNMDPRDRRQATNPYIKAEMTSADYRNGRDPAMEAILNCGYESIAQTLMPALHKNDFTKARELYQQFAKEPSHSCVNLEREMNTLGYQLMDHSTDAAIELFKMNVEKHPDSWNVYDSLAEAYAKKGDKELAIRNYRKSLDLNPNNSGAREALQKLGG